MPGGLHHYSDTSKGYGTLNVNQWNNFNYRLNGLAPLNNSNETLGVQPNNLSAYTIKVFSEPRGISAMVTLEGSDLGYNVPLTANQTSLLRNIIRRSGNSVSQDGPDRDLSRFGLSEVPQNIAPNRVEYNPARGIRASEVRALYENTFEEEFIPVEQTQNNIENEDEEKDEYF